MKSYLLLGCLLTLSNVASGATGLSFRNVSVRVVKDPFLEQGVTLRHLGVLPNIPPLSQQEMAAAVETGGGNLLNFSAFVSDPTQEETNYAYSLILTSVVIGYEGLVFDTTRIFDLDGAWTGAIVRPEALTLGISLDKPRVDPQDPDNRMILNWGSSWPKQGGGRGWEDVDSSSGSHRAKGFQHYQRVISLLQRSSHAYYHYVAEALPRIFLLWRDLQEHPDAPILIDVSFGNTWGSSFLELLGIDSSRIVTRRQDLVYFADVAHVAKPTQLHRAYPALVRKLKTSLLAVVHAKHQQPNSVIVIQRTKTNNQHSSQHQACLQTGGCRVREINNMPDFVEKLSSLYSKQRVVAFDSTSISVKDQVMEFARATTVIGVHGAGLCNVLFAPQGSLVFEIMPAFLRKASVATIFWHLSVGSELRHSIYLVPDSEMEPNSPTSLHNFRLPIDDVLSKLAALS